MQQRQLIRGIVIAVGLLVFSLAGAAVWLLVGSPAALLTAKPDLPAIVRLAPRSTVAMVALAVPLVRLQNFVQAATRPEQRRATRRAVDRFFSGRGPVGEFFRASNIDFAREIKPWLGSESMLAWGGERGSLLALETTNLERSNLFLNLFWQRQEVGGMPVQIDTYKGVQIASLSQPKPLATAALGSHYVALSDSPQLLKDAVDAWQVEPLSLVADPHFQRVIGPLQEPRIGWIYANVAQLSGSSPSKLQTLGLGIGANFKGLLAETLAEWDLPQTISPEKAGALLKTMPQDPSLLLSGRDLASTWQALRALPSLPNWDGTSRWETLLSQTGLDWGRDLFSQIRGEYALEVDDGWQWLLVANADPATTAQIEALDDKAKAANLEVSRLPLGSGEAVVWRRSMPAGKVVVRQARRAGDKAKRPDKPTLLCHLEQGGKLYLASSPQKIEQALSGPALATSRAWKQGVAPLPRSNQGYLYAHLPQALGLLPDSLALDRIQSIALAITETSALDAERSLQRGRLFLALR